MYMKSSIIVLAAIAELAFGHGAIVKAVGDQGGEGTALGVVATTPRDGSKRDPDQQDSTRFKNAAADACGETLGGGTNDPATQVPQMLAANGGNMPQISQGGMVMMTLHQVNGDGAGPYSCMIDSTGTGAQWTNMQVATNVPGKNSRSNAKATDFPLTAKVAADQECTGTAGGMTGVCMVRCNNDANAGPFGGCVPVQMVSGNATAAAKKTRRTLKFAV
ncbi:hypothetical protein GLAREA_10726 [Glarea lozoyensis ATCC 20868]|uniref:GEgh 16 protein n=2 Tax=Glarea lozoyensis TaxID=101852 RepID=S3DST0_GLAL2|nr:uncharacterized protein GLAREA_10726 [Glarea lozoyensis ATCC 20868]EHL00190.1 hypothetical protein M7I_3960 [Glarea lozoyensis 74030]EPE35031.1 hypothetical protein GLAREA_10726 [Glarea lozoyensis ATCC 20868]